MAEEKTEEKQESKIDKFLESVFQLEKSERLEKKAWFRLLRVLHALVMGLAVLVTVLWVWIAFDTKEITSATIACKDGTRWEGVKDGDLIDSYARCGLCTKRNADGRYFACTLSEMDFDAYETTNYKYRRTNSITEILIYPAIGLVVMLTVIKGIVKGIVYIIAGKET